MKTPRVFIFMGLGLGIAWFCYFMACYDLFECYVDLWKVGGSVTKQPSYPYQIPSLLFGFVALSLQSVGYGISLNAYWSKEALKLVK